MYQATIASEFIFSGIGLHSGREMPVKVNPAPANTGIMFRRTDVLNCPYVKVSPFNVTSTQLATTIACGDFPISTIEHLVSAFYGMGVDNVLVDVGGPEIPILDGSAAPIVDLIHKTGILVQEEKRQYIKIIRPINVEYDDKFVDAMPENKLRITFEIDYSHKAINYQKKEIVLSPDFYFNNISNARTFGFRKDVEYLHKMGLAKGGSMDNAIVLDDDDSILNPEGLRNKNEFVNHKILDLIGDFSLIGYRILGHVHAKKSGHHVNNLFARKLLESISAYELIELDSDEYCYGHMTDIVLAS